MRRLFAWMPSHAAIAAEMRATVAVAGPLAAANLA
jgi:hypothetical protein